MPSTQTRLQAEAIAAALVLVTGERPLLRTDGDSITVVFTEAQKLKLQDLLKDWLETPQGNLRVEVAPVVMPVVLRRIAPWLFGAAGGVLALTFWKRKRGS